MGSRKLHSASKGLLYECTSKVQLWAPQDVQDAFSNSWDIWANFPHMYAPFLIMWVTQDQPCQIRWEEEDGFGNCREHAESQWTDSETYEETVSRATLRHIRGNYSQDIEWQCLLAGCRLKTGWDADPHNICLYLVGIRSLCCPTSKFTVRNSHLNI